VNNIRHEMSLIWKMTYLSAGILYLTFDEHHCQVDSDQITVSWHIEDKYDAKKVVEERSPSQEERINQA
jgi:hypothetical protein